MPLTLITPPALGSSPLPGVAAVLVVFDPRSDPAAILGSVLQSVSRVVLLDNAPAGHPAVARWRNHPGIVVLANHNRGGLAGAYNLAIAWLRDNAPQLRCVALLDEDSDASVLGGFLADPLVAVTMARADTAAVAPAHRDRATGLRARHIVLQRWRWHYLPREVRGLQRVAFVINSMSVWRVEALRALGAHNEWLGVDHVDTEYCLRARQAGLAVYLHGDHEFAQSIGARKSYKLFGRELQSGGHGPARRHGIGRTTAWLGCRYAWREPAFAVLCFARLCYEAVGIVLVEDARAAKLSALARGFVAGCMKAFTRVAGTAA